MKKSLLFSALDLRSMKSYLANVYMLVGFGILLGVVLKSGGIVIIFSLITLVLLVFHPFSVAEKNKLETLYATLPIDRKAVVMGRYLFAAISATIGVVFTIICSTIITLIYNQSFDFAMTIFSACMVWAGFLIYIGLQFPIIFKLGYSKGRFVSYIPIFFIFAAFMFVPAFNANFTIADFVAFLIKHSAISSICALLIGISVVALSCFLSYKLYDKKDI